MYRTHFGSIPSGEAVQICGVGDEHKNKKLHGASPFKTQNPLMSPSEKDPHLGVGSQPATSVDGRRSGTPLRQGPYLP